jgi:hypothetical protein
MVIAGYPFFAGGHDVTLDDEGFACLKQLLLRHSVTIVMAGDTHDLEYFCELDATASTIVHHFINGGGGA